MTYLELKHPSARETFPFLEYTVASVVKTGEGKFDQADELFLHYNDGLFL